MTVVPGTYKWILSLPGGIIYGAPVAVAGDMNVNLNLIEHTVTVVAKNPSGEPVAGVKTKAEGGFNTKLAPVAATLAPGFEAEAVAWDHPQATTNAEGKLQFSIPDIEPPQSTVELIPPPESGLVNTTIDVANVTTDETREVTVPQGAHVLGTVTINGAPVSGATVWIGSTEAKASGSGAFSMTVVPGTYKWILSLPGGVIYGAPVAVAGDMNVNLNLIEHTVTVVAKNPSGEPVAGVKTKAEGGFNTKLAPVAATLAPGFEAEAVAWDHPQATTNAEGKLQFSIPDIEPPQSTVELIPPPESGLVNTTIDVANVTTDETREVTLQ